jgi:hypothetical protein
LLDGGGKINKKAKRKMHPSRLRLAEAGKSKAKLKNKPAEVIEFVGMPRSGKTT